MPLTGAGMRRHVHSGNHAAESFVSFIPLLGGPAHSGDGGDGNAGSGTPWRQPWLSNHLARALRHCDHAARSAGLSFRYDTSTQTPRYSRNCFQNSVRFGTEICRVWSSRQLKRTCSPPLHWPDGTATETPDDSVAGRSSTSVSTVPPSPALHDSSRTSASHIPSGDGTGAEAHARSQGSRHPAAASTATSHANVPLRAAPAIIRSPSHRHRSATGPPNTGDKLRSGARVHPRRRGHEAAPPAERRLRREGWCRRKLRQLHPLVRWRRSPSPRRSAWLRSADSFRQQMLRHLPRREEQ
jgi:hypothetical protein